MTASRRSISRRSSAPRLRPICPDAGADPDVASRNDQRVHPLHSAVAGGSFAVSRRLVDEGADVDAVQQGGFRPLHAAAQNGDELTVDLLLMAGARPWATTDDGKTRSRLRRGCRA